MNVVVWAVCALLCACGIGRTVRTSVPSGGDIKPPPTASRDMWQRPSVVVDHLELQAGMAVMDLGAGNGYMLPHLSKAVGAQGKVYGVEIDDGQIKSLQKRFNDKKWANVEVVQSTESTLPVTKQVDRILLLNTYPEWADPIAMSKVLTERLKPGGWFVVIDYVPDPKVPGPAIEDRLSMATIEAEARGAGLALVATSDALPRQYIAVFMRAEEVSEPPPAVPLAAGATQGQTP